MVFSLAFLKTAFVKIFKIASQKQDLYIRKLRIPFNFLAQFKPIKTGHINICQNDIGLKT